uniref:Centrosomal protein of 290kDa coiled-coil region domain-containing protein n=1 Tax=Trichuris muris TaxID=70415 RepID=A0A5S6QA90_TRIMR
MGFSKWTELQKLDFENFDEADMESWVPVVVSADINGEDDPARLKALFNLSKLLLEVKAAQAEVALDELEHLTGQKMNLNSTREQRLIIENNRLKEKLAASLVAYSDNEKSLFVLKEELQELREQNHQLTLEYDELHSEMIRDKEAVTKSNAKVEQYEKEVLSLSQERNELMANLRNTQRQLESQQDVDVLARKFELNELQVKIRTQNQEVLKMLEDLNALTETNDLYQRQIKELKDSLQESAAQMELAADECMQLKTINDQLGKLVDSLQAENNELREQISNSNAAVIQTADDNVMNMVDKKIDEWKRRLDDKDEELNVCKAKIAAQNVNISQYKLDGERTSIPTLKKVLVEREEQIECLKNALKEATKEMECNASLIEELNKELHSENEIGLISLRRELRRAEMEIRTLRRGQEESEMTRVEKERQIADLLDRLRQFEQGEYGLEEAINEIYLLNKRLNVRNEQLYEIVQHCNLIELNLSELFDENNTFRERLQLEKRRPLDLELKTTAQVLEKGTDLSSMTVNGRIEGLVLTPKEEKPSPETEQKKTPIQEPPLPVSDKLIDEDVSKELITVENVTDRKEDVPVLISDTEEPTLDVTMALPKDKAVEEIVAVDSTISSLQADAPVLVQLSECMRKLVKEAEENKKHLDRLNCALTIAKQKLGSMNRQHTLKCEELTRCKEEMDKERIVLNGTINDQLTEIEMAGVKVAELERTIDLLSKGSENLIKQRIVEVVRHQILTRLENVCLKRRLLLSEQSLGVVDKECATLKSKAKDLRCALSRKTAFFEKRQKVSIYKIASLRRKLEASVPAAEFRKLETRFKELFQKYANKLFVETSSTAVALESEKLDAYSVIEESPKIYEKSEPDHTENWSIVDTHYPADLLDSEFGNELEEADEIDIDEMVIDERKEQETLAIEQAVEIEQLRRALNHLRSKTDKNMQIGQLHCEIVSLKLAAIDKDNKIRDAHDLEEKMENMKRAMKDKLKELKKAKSAYNQKENALIGQINELKKNLRESIPLNMAEKFHKIGNTLLCEQKRLNQKSKEVEAKAAEIDDKADALAIREKVLEKLLLTIENKEEREELIAMAEKVQRLRIENAKLDRLVKRVEKEDESNRSLIHSLKESIFKLSSHAKFLDSAATDADFPQAILEYDMLSGPGSPKIGDNVEASIHKEADWLDEEIDRLKLFIRSKLTMRYDKEAMEKSITVSSSSPRGKEPDMHDQIPRESFLNTLTPLLQEKISEREDRFDACGKRIQALEEEVAFLRAQYNILLAPLDKYDSQKPEIPAKRRKEQGRSPREHIELQEKIEKYKTRIVELEGVIKAKEEEIIKLKESAAHWQNSRKELESKDVEHLSTSPEISQEVEETDGPEVPEQAEYEEQENVESVRLSETGSIDENQSTEASSLSDEPSFADDGSMPKVAEIQSPLPPIRAETVPLEMHLKLKLEWERLKQMNRQLQLENRKLVKALTRLKEELMKTAVAQKTYGTEAIRRDMENGQKEVEPAKPHASKLELEYLDVRRKLELKQIRLEQVLQQLSSLSAENKRLKSEVDLSKSSPTEAHIAKKKKNERISHITDTDSEDHKKAGGFGKWTEYKKWQSLYENVKIKLGAKIQEIAKLKKTEERLRNRITRLEQQINFMESERSAEAISALQDVSKPLLKAQDELASNVAFGDVGTSIRKQKTQSHVTLIRATAEEAEKMVETLENKVAELFKVIDSKNKSEEQHLEKIRLLEKQLHESQERGHRLQESLQASTLALKDRLTDKGLADGRKVHQEFNNKPVENEHNWNYLKQKITVTRSIDGSEFQNQVSVSTQREVFYPWLLTKDSPSPINKVIRENNILRERLKRAQMELEDAYKEIEYNKANQSFPCMDEWQKATDHLCRKQDASRMVKTDQVERNRVNVLQEILKQEIEKCHKLKIENDRLNRKIEALDGALRCESHMENHVFQNVKMMNFELLEEIDDLKFELDVYCRKIKPALLGNNGSLDVARVKERAKIYDRVLRENVELKLELSLLRSRV